MGTLKGSPDPPALWLRRAKPASANATVPQVSVIAVAGGALVVVGLAVGAGAAHVADHVVHAAAGHGEGLGAGSPGGSGQLLATRGLVGPVLNVGGARARAGDGQG